MEEGNDGPVHLRPLQELVISLQQLCLKNHGTKVSIGDIVKMLGPRSFAPLVLAVGLIGITPLDSIPTLPTTFGVIILLTVGQMLIGQKSLWLPDIIARRAVKADRLKSALDWLKPHAARADKWLGVRLRFFTQGVFLLAVAVCCAILAALMPMLELVPLISTVPSLAFTAFGIALLMHDGVAAVAGFLFTALTLALVVEVFRLPF